MVGAGWRVSGMSVEPDQRLLALNELGDQIIESVADHAEGVARVEVLGNP